MHPQCMSEVRRGFSVPLDVAPEARVQLGNVDRWSLEAGGNRRLGRIEWHDAFELQIGGLRSERVITAQHQSSRYFLHQMIAPSLQAWMLRWTAEWRCG